MHSASRTAPHVTAELSSEDYRAGQDPALKATLAYSPRKALTQLSDGALTEGGARLALKRFRESKAAPFNKYADAERPLLDAGQRMLDGRKNGQALLLFKLAAEENPRSSRAHYATAFTHSRRQQGAAREES